MRTVFASRFVALLTLSLTLQTTSAHADYTKMERVRASEACRNYVASKPLKNRIATFLVKNRTAIGTAGVVSLIGAAAQLDMLTSASARAFPARIQLMLLEGQIKALSEAGFKTTSREAERAALQALIQQGELKGLSYLTFKVLAGATLGLLGGVVLGEALFPSSSGDLLEKDVDRIIKNPSLLYGYDDDTACKFLVTFPDAVRSFAKFEDELRGLERQLRQNEAASLISQASTTDVRAKSGDSAAGGSSRGHERVEAHSAI